MPMRSKYMSEYFKTIPLGIGTCQAESLASYYSRFCNLHGLSLVQMARHLSNWVSLSNDIEFKLSESLIYSQSGFGLNSCSSNTQIYIDVIEKGNGIRNLNRHTFLPLRKILSSRDKKLQHKTRYWCPACFNEDKSNDTPYYDRLAWCMYYVNRCNIHNIDLISACPACGVIQRHYASTGKIELCYKCHSYLALNPSEWVRNFIPTFGERECYNLVEYISDGQLDNISPDAFELFCDQISLYDPKLGYRISNISRASGSKIANRQQSKHNLSTLIRKSLSAGVQPYQILLDPLNSARILGELDFIKYQDSLPRRNIKARSLIEFSENQILIELNKPLNQKIPSFTQFCMNLNISTGYCRYHHPMLTSKYIIKYKRQKLNKISENYANVSKLLNNGLMAEYCNGHISSQDHAIEIIVDKCKVSKAYARTIFKIFLTYKRNEQH